MVRSSWSFLLIALLMLIMGVGCADDLRQRNIFDGGAEDVMLLFSVENVAFTRSEWNRNMETEIDHAYLLFYPSDSDMESSLPLAAVRADISESNPSALKFKMPLLLEPDTDYRLVAIANADWYVPDGFGSYYKDYIEAWYASSSSDVMPLLIFNPAPMLAGDIHPLPMRGDVLNGGMFRYAMQDGAYKINSSLSFRRLVARIDVTNMVREGFIVEEIALCNWRDAVSVLSDDNELGNRIGAVRGVYSGDEADDGGPFYIDMPSPDEAGVQQLNESLYCFPSVSYTSYPSDHESTALIIKARYGDDMESSYYRVNVGVTGNRSQVKANTKYLVTIQSVKGRGASSAEEAYASDQSPIVLSVVEDWDLEGCLAMDDNGNFILVSTGFLEFEGDDVASREVRILTSKGLAWDVEYVADNEESVSSFSVSRLSDSSIAVRPSGRNDGDYILSGKLMVSATNPAAAGLSMVITLVQKKSSGLELPDIPEGMPFALIPLSTDGRVRVDHNSRTIEIDGFESDCFNSFLDIPFLLCVRNESEDASVSLSSNLLWPLEGRIALSPSSSYYYCNESFASQGMGKVMDAAGRMWEYSSMTSESVVPHPMEDVVYISVGAMAPDDPAIERIVTITSYNGDKIEYKLRVRPRDCVIDDVILSDHSGRYWMIMDRNLLRSTSPYWKYADRDAYGNKRQAYNYSKCDVSFTIPGKFRLIDAVLSEDGHAMYCGDFLTPTNIRILSSYKTAWVSKLKYSNTDSPSPQFYDDSHSASWVFPTPELVELCCEKMRVSKMRMYLMSEFSAKDGDADIPVCCYWPYQFAGEKPIEKSFPRYGYYISEKESTIGVPVSMIFPLFDGVSVNAYKWEMEDDDNGLTRLLRSLSQEELDEYKINYLGYGSESHRLKLCHPDTYTSEPLGWQSY